MKIAMLVYYTFLRHLREYRVSISFIVMPLVMIAILGAALNYDFTPKNIDTIKIGFVVDREDELTQAVEDFLNSDDIASLIEIHPIEKLEEGVAAIKRGDVESVIYIPNKSYDHPAIEIYSNNEATIAYPVMENFVRIIRV